MRVSLVSDLDCCAVHTEHTFSGDQDSVIPLIGTRQLIIILAQDLNLRAATSYKNWVVNQQVVNLTQTCMITPEVTERCHWTLGWKSKLTLTSM